MTQRVLLVEDSESDEKLTRLAFQRSGVAHELVVVRDGAEALDYLFATGAHAARNMTQPLAVVLLDLNLPKVSGLDVLQQLRADARTRLQPVVVLTSSRQDEDIVRSYELGANAYVRKPVDFTDFSAATRTLGVFWLELNEAPGGRLG